MPSAGAAGGLQGLDFALDGRVMRDRGDAAQESCGAVEMVCFGRLLGGMKGREAAAGAGGSFAAIRRLSIQLSSTAESMQCVHALVDRLGRDVLRTNGANGLGQAKVKGETRIAESAQHRGPKSLAITSKERVIERSLFTVKADDDGEASKDLKAFKTGADLVSRRAWYIRPEVLRRFICMLQSGACDYHEDELISGICGNTKIQRYTTFADRSGLQIVHEEAGNTLEREKTHCIEKITEQTVHITVGKEAGKEWIQVCHSKQKALLALFMFVCAQIMTRKKN
jgi:hypothetical protein